jgi:hypothetical protein
MFERPKGKERLGPEDAAGSHGRFKAPGGERRGRPKRVCRGIAAREPQKMTIALGDHGLRPRPTDLIASTTPQRALG